MSARLSPEREAEIAAAVALYEGHPNIGFACCSAHGPADGVRELLAELAAVRAERDQARAELAEFASRVNELESRLCECEPVREHSDYKRPAFYQHAAGCPVNRGA